MAVASETGKLRVAFILARSFTLSAFSLFIDTLRLASDQLDRSGRIKADWQVLASSRNLITASCGIQVAPTSDFIDPRRFDYVVVVGGLLAIDEPVDRAGIAYIKSAAAANVPIIGLCTGTFILAEAGLMNDHECCVSWLHAREFRSRFPHLAMRSDRIFSLKDKRGSCAGGSSSADMAASIVRRFISRDAEKNAMEVLQIDMARSSSHPQARRSLDEETDDVRIRSTLAKMEQHLDTPLSMGDLSRRVNLSRRQLERIFRDKLGISPIAAYQKLRLSHAKNLLLHTNNPIIDIALEAGFENPAQFSRVFKRVHGQTPTDLRATAIRF